MRLEPPPLKAGEEVDHVRIAFEHDHAVVAPAVDPAAARVRPGAGTALGGLARSLIRARHRHLPRRAPIRVRGGAVRITWTPDRIVVLVAVLLVHLRDDAARCGLQAALVEHPLVQRTRPLLERSEPEPRRG